VGFIRAGRLVDIQDVTDLKGKAFNQLELHFAAPVPETDFSGLAGVRDVVVDDRVVRCTVAGSLDAVIKAAAQHEVVNLYSHEPNLEDIFMAYYGEGNDVS
jgi:ABC-2 type transport system ATP-binding protein